MQHVRRDLLQCIDLSPDNAVEVPPSGLSNSTLDQPRLLCLQQLLLWDTISALRFLASLTVSVFVCRLPMPVAIYRRERQSGSDAIPPARFREVHCNSPHRWHSVRPALAIHYHGYQELHVAQFLLLGWWHEPLLSFVVLGSQILQGLDAVTGSNAFVALLSLVRAGSQIAQVHSTSGVFARRPDWSRIRQHMVVDRAAHAVQAHTRVTKNSYRNNHGLFMLV